MSSTIPKLVLFCSNFIPFYKTLAENLGVPFRHGKPKQIIFHRNLSRRTRLYYCKKTDSNNPASSRLTKKRESFKFPSLVYIQNLLKTQPNFKLRSLFRIKEKLSDWPLFDRSKQHEKPFNLRNLVKTRQSADIPLLNEKDLIEMQFQKYQPQRVKNLGPDLTAVHFFVDRRAAVRLTDQIDWIVGGVPKCTTLDQLSYCQRGCRTPDEDCYVTRCYIEALDCSNFDYTGIRYEGLKYLTGLQYLKWLSLKNQRHINVWCLDRIAGLVGNTLEYLDISKCDLDLGCIIALSRMQALKTLVIKDQGNNEITKALSCLKELNPNLTVKSIGIVQNLFNDEKYITEKRVSVTDVNS